MEKQRKEELYKGVKLKAVLKTVILCIVIFLLLTFLLYLFSNVFGLADFLEYIHGFMLIVLFYVLILFFVIFRDMIEIEKEKISKKIVEEIFSKDNYVKVFPISGHLKYKTFFYEEMPKKAEYFGKLSDDGKHVCIFLKFDKYEEEFFLQYVESKEFANAYNVVE